MTADQVLTPQGVDSDAGLDQALRPRNFVEFVGQRGLVENLSVYIQAARERGEPLDHLLLSGLPGLGKTTLANIVARELAVECRVTSGPALTRPGDLAGILTGLSRGDLLFIDEIHRLPAAVEEYLYAAMEDFSIDILIDQGPSARSVRVPLPRFTLVGATTREGLLSAPFRSRFGLLEKLDLYPPEDIAEIVRRSASRLSVAIDEDSVGSVSRVSRGTPRVANRLVKRLRDFAQVEGGGRISSDICENALRRLGIDEQGLVETDRRILRALHRAGASPVGLKTLAVAVGEEQETIEDVYEPFLITEGWLVRTPRGRTLTDRAFRWFEEREGTPRHDGRLF